MKPGGLYSSLHAFLEGFEEEDDMPFPLNHVMINEISGFRFDGGLFYLIIFFNDVTYNLAKFRHL